MPFYDYTHVIATDELIKTEVCNGSVLHEVFMAKDKPTKIVSKKHLARLERERRQTRLITSYCYWHSSHHCWTPGLWDSERNRPESPSTGSYC